MFEAFMSNLSSQILTLIGRELYEEREGGRLTTKYTEKDKRA